MHSTVRVGEKVVKNLHFTPKCLSDVSLVDWGLRFFDFRFEQLKHHSRLFISVTCSSPLKGIIVPIYKHIDF